MIFSTSHNALLIYLIVAGVSVIVGLLLWFLVRIIQSSSDEVAYDNQIEELVSHSDEEDIMGKTHGNGVAEKWTIYWRSVGKTSGFPRWENDNNSAPTDVIWIAIIMGLVFGGITRSIAFGIVVPILTVFVLGLYLRMKFNSIAGDIQDQLSGFLFALRANIQANETPSRAIIKITDNMPEPLRGDLTIVKQNLLANSTFPEAISAMIAKTTSTELKFLGACLIQAAATGSNIEPQIITIQHTIEQRKKASDEVTKAVKATLPSIYVASFAIPVSLFGAYLLAPDAKQFWFHKAASWVVLLIVGVLWGAGLFFTRKMVNKIRNL
jgi:Flp pilus assembly protein TadB